MSGAYMSKFFYYLIVDVDEKVGLYTQMLYGVINRLKAMNIENAYKNSYDWRKAVYNRCGFETEEPIGF